MGQINCIPSGPSGDDREEAARCIQLTWRDIERKAIASCSATENAGDINKLLKSVPGTPDIVEIGSVDGSDIASSDASVDLNHSVPSKPAASRSLTKSLLLLSIFLLGSAAVQEYHHPDYWGTISNKVYLDLKAATMPLPEKVSSRKKGKGRISK